jgi:hypothetical protein
VQTPFVIISHSEYIPDQNAGHSHNVKTDNSLFEKVEEFKYFGTNFINTNTVIFRKKLRAD